DVDLGRPDADLVLAMGSLQYARAPEEAIVRLAQWAGPGGAVCVLVDSYAALVVELLREGRTQEALARLDTPIGTWTQDDLSAELHLLDRARLEEGFARAGLVDVRSAGLLVGATVLGRDALVGRLAEDWDEQLRVERRLAASPLLADLGKQLLVSGRRPRG